MRASGQGGRESDLCLLVEKKVNLPIHEYWGEIVETVHRNRVTIIVGETGSGKTTQVPQYLYHAGFAKEGAIGITEPRRIAAISTAKYVADQMKLQLGGLVGYQVRFDDETTAGTKVKFMTDGILLREFQLDPELRKFSLVMVDEAHERSQNIDFALGLLKDLLQRRDDLKVVVASATIDEQKFSKYFWDSPIINVSGRMFPVETIWSDNSIPEGMMAEEIVKLVSVIHRGEAPGDVLVFMTGEQEIHKVIEGIEELGYGDIVAIPAYAALPTDTQEKIFECYPGKRKVVVATNIAETSITIDGVVYVVDSGLIKQSNFHAESGIKSLDVVEHSQAGCDQRKGRAGRTQPGTCYRFYTEEDYLGRPRFTEPDIRRSPLASVVLAMEDIGIENIKEFDFIDPPERVAFTEAYETLIALGAIRRGEKGLTEIGKAMARLPLEPRIARMLLDAEKYSCVKEVATYAAFLSVRNVFVRPKGKEDEADFAHSRFKATNSDALTALEIWRAYEDASCSRGWCFSNFLNAKTLEEVSKIRTQLFETLERHNIAFVSSEPADTEGFLKAVCAGLAYNLYEHADRQWYHGLFRNGGDYASIHPGSAAFSRFSERWIVAMEVVRTTKVWLRGVTVVKPQWLPGIAPTLFTFGKTTLVSYNPGDKEVTAEREVIYQGNSVGTAPVKISLPEARRIQAESIVQAERQGLLLLTFRKVKDHLYSLDRWVAERDGLEYRAWSSSMSRYGDEDSQIIAYCSVDDFILGPRVKPVIRVFEFPPEEVVQQKGEKATKLGLAQLAEKWGAKLK